MTKRSIRKAVETPLTLADVTEGDTVTLEYGMTAEVGFFIGSSCFVRFSDNHEPRAISSLSSSTPVVSVQRRERVLSSGSVVKDPLQ